MIEYYDNMPLNLDNVSTQINSMSVSLSSQHDLRLTLIEKALESLITLGLNKTHAPTKNPIDYQVLAVDGSHIDIDRHMPVRCALINLSKIVLRYGETPFAILDSHPDLYANPEELYIRNPDGEEKLPLQGPLLSLVRTVQEASHLAQIAEDNSTNIPTLALIDGSLILWGPELSTYPKYIRTHLLEDGILDALDRIQALAAKYPLALAAYISLPRSTTILNSLPISQQVKDGVGEITDRDLFEQTLNKGERSDIFDSNSSLVKEYYADQSIHFYYLNTGDEIARVEVPSWVAKDQGMLELSHSLILDQCEKGFGYPVAIMEAHEQAVIGGSDRELFRKMVEDSLTKNQLPVYTSQKERSKRLRLI